MASKRKAFLSRSVSLSLAALIVLTGAMFLITTLEQDHQEWVLVDDEVIQFNALTHNHTSLSNYVEEGFTTDFDEGTYTISVPEDVSRVSSSSMNIVCMSCLENFDFSKDYKFVFHSNLKFGDFFFGALQNTSSPVTVQNSNTISLRNFVSDDDGTFTANVILTGQPMVDFSFKDYFFIGYQGPSSSGTFDANDLTVQIYTLEDDNAGSIAAAITGLTLIVMGVFATPMLNVFRRK